MHASIESLSVLSAIPRAVRVGPAPAGVESADSVSPRAPRAEAAALRSAPPSPAAQAAPVARKPILPFATEPLAAPPAGSKSALLTAMRGPVLACTKCPALVQSRTQVVFGVGDAEAELMFVGEAPGADEDAQGEPFVGRAGQLLTKIIETMGFARHQVYIANVLKCRPDMPPGASGNRKPTPDEMRTCLPYLEQQIGIVQPRVIVALGATAMDGLLGKTEPMGKMRGQWHDFRGTPVMSTFHPSYLLHNQALSEKRKVWEDMLLVLERLGRTITEKQRSFFQSKG